MRISFNIWAILLTDLKQIEKVQETVKTEISAWSNIVKKNCQPSGNSAKIVQKAVKSAVEENNRSNNFLVYGAEEEDDGVFENHTNFTNWLFNETGVFPKPQVVAVSRIGFCKPENSGKPRPIKVTLASNESVKQVLSTASKLKQQGGDIWPHIYLAPDRDRKERAAHQKLVTMLKEKISEDSTKYHYIKDSKIISVDKVVSTT